MASPPDFIDKTSFTSFCSPFCAFYGKDVATEPTRAMPYFLKDGEMEEAL